MGCFYGSYNCLLINEISYVRLFNRSGWVFWFYKLHLTGIDLATMLKTLISPKIILALALAVGFVSSAEAAYKKRSKKRNKDAAQEQVVQPEEATAAAVVPASVDKSMHGLDGKLIGYLKMPALKGFSEKLMETARLVKPGEQTEMIPFGLFGFLGYPTFPGLSSTENASIFFYGDKGNAVPVILVKLAQDSPTRANLNQWGWIAEDHKGWTLVARSKEDIALVGDAGSLNKMIALNHAPGEYEMEFRLFTDYLKLSEQTLKTAVRSQNPNEKGVSPQADQSTMRLVDLAIEELENFKWMSFGMDLGEQRITLGMAAEAKEGTPEGTLLASKVGGPVPLADYVAADGAIAFAGKYDPQALLAYGLALSYKVKPRLGDHGKKTMETMDEILTALIPPADGTFAGVLNIGDNGAWYAKTVNGGKWNDDVYVKWAKAWYSEVMPTLTNHFVVIRNVPLQFKYEYTPNASIFDGIRIHKAVSTYTYTVEPPLDVAFGSPVSREQEVFTRVRNEFMSIDAGRYLYANEMEDMKSLITALHDATPVPGNINTFYKPDATAALKYQVNMVKFSRQMAGGKLLAEHNPAYAKGLDALEKENLKPVDGEVEVEKGEIKVYARVPKDTLSKLSALVQQAQSRETVQVEVLTVEEIEMERAGSGQSQEGAKEQETDKSNAAH